MARRRRILGRHEYWRRAFLAVIAVVSGIGGVLLFEAGKPLQLNDLNLVKNYETISVWVSDPQATAYVSYVDLPPDRGRKAGLDYLDLTISPAADATTVDYLVILEGPGRLLKSPGGASYVGSAASYVGWGPRRTGSARIALGRVTKGQRIGPIELSLPTFRRSPSGILQSRLPELYPIFLPGLREDIAEGCGTGPFKPTVLVDNSIAAGNPNHCAPRLEKYEQFYSPGSLTTEEQLVYDPLDHYQILNDQPSDGVVDRGQVTWTGGGGMSPLLTAALPGIQDRRSTFTFLSGVALAGLVAALIALVQEIRDSDDKETSDAGPQPWTTPPPPPPPPGIRP